MANRIARRASRPATSAKPKKSHNLKSDQQLRVERRNVRINGRRTTVKLEHLLWESLHEICEDTGRNLDEICSEVAQSENARTNFTSELRLYVISYYRELAHVAQKS